MKYSKNKGFTLIELLVVIAIIAILTAVIMTNLYSSRGKARDAKRISDIAQIQLALEQYFNKNGGYPSDQSSLVPDTLKDQGYISVIPTDPTTRSKYTYVTDSNGTHFDYVLKATLEYTNGATADALTGTIYGQSCNAAATAYCVGPK
jgi:type II secretion system protein G